MTLDSALRSMSESLRLDKNTPQAPGILNGLQHLLNTGGEQCPLVFHLAFILTIPLSPSRFLLPIAHVPSCLFCRTCHALQSAVRRSRILLDRIGSHVFNSLDLSSVASSSWSLLLPPHSLWHELCCCILSSSLVLCGNNPSALLCLDASALSLWG